MNSYSYKVCYLPILCLWKKEKKNEISLTDKIIINNEISIYSLERVTHQKQ